MEEQKNMVSFFDSVQRTIIGEFVEDNGDSIRVKNPVVVNVTMTQDGKTALQLIPVFYREFMADPTNDIVITYNKTTISIVDSFKDGWESKIYTHYDRMIPTEESLKAQQAPAPAVDTTKDDRVIDLFSK